jgi:hypothetical protein
LLDIGTVNESELAEIERMIRDHREKNR